MVWLRLRLSRSRALPWELCGWERKERISVSLWRDEGRGRRGEDEDEDEGDGFKGGEGRGSASGPSSRELLKEPLLEGNGEGTRSVTTTKLNPMLDAEVMFASPCFFCG